jgi:membrane-associated phospholipid phosphatase
MVSVFPHPQGLELQLLPPPGAPVGQVAAVVVTLVVCWTALAAGRERLTRLREEFTLRFRSASPYFVGLLLVFGVNSVVKDYLPDLSWVIGLDITGAIYAIEGGFVLLLQSYATPSLTRLFSFAYIYLYPVILIVPFAIYLTFDDPVALRETTFAYVTNYAIGSLCYLLFIAYGPRNLLYGDVKALLFETFPEYHIITAQVNVNVNVFPSLHTSLSVTVALLAWRTRKECPRFFWGAAPMASVIVLSTMYLGIHWLTDVVAGMLLAAISVVVAERYVDPEKGWITSNRTAATDVEATPEGE